ncbi:MAG: hypothetical protein KC488_08480 [Candidatus Cloacimonetes bacterium]|nr:hypothetical protein [Candidatus Cloacimonadota bacterium]
MLRLTTSTSNCPKGLVMPLILLLIWILLAPITFAGDHAFPAETATASTALDAPDSHVNDTLSIVEYRAACWNQPASLELTLGQERGVRLELWGQRVGSRRVIDAGKLKAGQHSLALPTVCAEGELMTVKVHSEGMVRCMKVLTLD